MSQVPQQTKVEQEEEKPQQQNLPSQQSQTKVQYYPIFYIKPNDLPFPMNTQQNASEGENPWFVCHPVFPNDPFYSYVSQFSQAMNKHSTMPNDFPIKIEEDVQKQTLEQKQSNPSLSKRSSEQKKRIKKLKEHKKQKSEGENQKEIELLPCNCAQSNCLKRYCACFHSGRICLDECQCKDCKNCPQYAEEREQAINHVFKKCHRDKNVPINQLLSLEVSYGCKCKSTGCQKKYCECFKRGQVCSDLCSCEDCLNVGLNLTQPEIKSKKISTLQ